MIFLQLLINSLIAGSIYALIASGFSLIYSTNRFMHFAHGAVVVFSAYIFWAINLKTSLPLVTAAILTILFASLLGSFLFKGVYGPLQRKKSSNVILLIASVGLLILIENMLLLIVGSDIRLVKYISLQKGISFFGAFISPSQLVILATTLIIFISLGVFLNKSRLGRKLRAVSDNRNLAKTSGIHTERIQLISFLMGSALAGIAGILISLEQAIEPTLGTSFAIKGFIGSIIGGIGSIPGALLGSYFLGLVENFGTWYLPSAYKEGIAFLLLLIFLLWKPNGFLGVKKQ